MAATPTKVGLSTASVFPEPAERAFELAAELGYDGIELMVWNDQISQDPAAVRQLKHKYGVPVLSIHAPCLFVTQRVWGQDPWLKVERSAAAAALLKAHTVALHPPFRWQRSYAAEFAEGVRAIEEEFQINVAVENMFPLRLGERPLRTYAPGWDVVLQGHASYTLDTSHTSVSRSDAMQMALDMGSALKHLHIADGTGRNSDEHLVPGRGNQPCAEVLRYVADLPSCTAVIVEVNTRGPVGSPSRVRDLTEALAFCRQHLGQ